MYPKLLNHNTLKQLIESLLYPREGIQIVHYCLVHIIYPTLLQVIQCRDLPKRNETFLNSLSLLAGRSRADSRAQNVLFHSLD